MKEIKKSMIVKVPSGKKQYTYYLTKKIDDRLKELGEKSGIGKSGVLTMMVEMFGDIYSNLIDVINKYDGECGETLDEYLRKNGYGFIVDGKCK